MKRVAFLISDITNFGGTQRVVSVLANNFIERLNLEVHIYSLQELGQRNNYEYNSRIIFHNIDHEFKLKNIFKILKKINSLNKEYKIDLILGIGCYLSVFLPFLKNVKKIACEHNSYDIVSKKTMIVRKIMYRFVDVIVSLTEEDKEKYLRINRNTFVIPNPIPFRINEELINNIERRNVVISVGSLNKRKGYDRLLKIWEKVEEKNDEFILEIYGDGEEKSNLIEQVKSMKLKNVRFMGNTSEIQNKLLKSKIFVMTSRKEGFPMVLLEAMTCGLPVVSFDIKTGPKEIIKDGIDGFLIPDNEINLFSDKLLYLIENTKIISKMSKEAVKNIRKYEIDNIIEKWKEMI